MFVLSNCWSMCMCVYLCMLCLKKVDFASIEEKWSKWLTGAVEASGDGVEEGVLGSEQSLATGHRVMIVMSRTLRRRDNDDRLYSLLTTTTCHGIGLQRQHRTTKKSRRQKFGDDIILVQSLTRMRRRVDARWRHFATVCLHAHADRALTESAATARSAT